VLLNVLLIYKLAQSLEKYSSQSIAIFLRITLVKKFASGEIMNAINLKLNLNSIYKIIFLFLVIFCSKIAYAQSNKFTFTSPDLKNSSFDNQYILNGFGCKGGNISPALEWKNIPAGTKSFSIQMHDPDAPTGSGFWHWAVYNIPATKNKLARGAGNSPDKLPTPAIGGATDFQDTGATGLNGNYGGPCPPQGDKPHKYIFTIYALDVEDIHKAAGIPKTGTSALHSFILNKAIGKSLLAKASFTATYGR
jgi:Raf kinase inhibitor-like YbhB/YbcL family protein